MAGLREASQKDAAARKQLEADKAAAQVCTGNACAPECLCAGHARRQYDAFPCGLPACFWLLFLGACPSCLCACPHACSCCLVILHCLLQAEVDRLGSKIEELNTEVDSLRDTVAHLGASLANALADGVASAGQANESGALVPWLWAGAALTLLVAGGQAT